MHILITNSTIYNGQKFLITGKGRYKGKEAFLAKAVNKESRLPIDLVFFRREFQIINKVPQ